MPNGYDKNWVRLCGAIDGFRVRFGHWPSKVLLNRIILNDLEHGIFLPESMKRIKDKVSLVVQDADIVAQDEFGNQYSYGDEGFPARRPRIDARKWLGVEPDRPDPEYEWG
jgi:hypothetical protein